MKCPAAPRRARSFPSLGMLILALVVFSGTIDRVPGRGGHLVLDAAGDLLYSPAAIHPAQPLHVERVTVAKSTWPPIGVQRMRSKGADLCPAVTVAQLELRSLLPEPPDLASGGASHRPTGARAPPFA